MWTSCNVYSMHLLLIPSCTQEGKAIYNRYISCWSVATQFFIIFQPAKKPAAMDEFFQNNGCSHQETATLQWFDDFPLVNPSAFVKYVDQRVGGMGKKGDGSGSSRDGNANKRMMEFLGKMWKPALQTMQTAQERVHRHMINERMRRERQKQSYLALHRLLPLGTKVSMHFSFFWCTALNRVIRRGLPCVQYLIWSQGRICSVYTTR